MNLIGERIVRKMDPPEKWLDSKRKTNDKKKKLTKKTIIVDSGEGY